MCDSYIDDDKLFITMNNNVNNNALTNGFKFIGQRPHQLVDYPDSSSDEEVVEDPSDFNPAMDLVSHQISSLCKESVPCDE